MKSTDKKQLDTNKNSGITNLSDLNDPFQLNNGIKLKNHLVKLCLEDLVLVMTFITCSR